MNILASLFSSLLASLPGVLLALIRPIITKKFLTRVMGKLIIKGAEYLSKKTDTRVDDGLVADWRQALRNAGVEID